MPSSKRSGMARWGGMAAASSVVILGRDCRRHRLLGHEAMESATSVGAVDPAATK